MVNSLGEQHIAHLSRAWCSVFRCFEEELQGYSALSAMNCFKTRLLFILILIHSTTIENHGHMYTCMLTKTNRKTLWPYQQIKKISFRRFCSSWSTPALDGAWDFLAWGTGSWNDSFNDKMRRSSSFWFILKRCVCTERLFGFSACLKS